MDSGEEKFFESLAKSGGAPIERNLEVELARSDSATAAKPTISTKRSKEIDAEPEGQLTIDVYQTPNEIIVESAVAGVKPDDLDVSVSNDSITIRGRRHRESEIRDEDYFYQECYWGRFSRSVILPQEIDPESAWVNFKNGILTVHLPKLNRSKTRKLKVKLE